MNTGPRPLGELMDDYEAELTAAYHADMAREQAAFDALPLAERERILAERAAKLAAALEPDDTEQPDEDDCDDEDEDEDDDSDSDEENDQ